MLWVRISLMARCTTLCDKVWQWLSTGRWFSRGPPVSSTNKTDRHDIAEILLELSTIKQTTYTIYLPCCCIFHVNGCCILHVNGCCILHVNGCCIFHVNGCCILHVNGCCIFHVNGCCIFHVIGCCIFHVNAAVSSMLTAVVSSM